MTNTVEYNREYYLTNKARSVGGRRESVRRRSEENRVWLRGLKESRPCVDCGRKYPYYVMDFDHLGDKIRGVSRMMSYKREVIEREIAKCELVCANCHRIRTHSRRGSLAER